MAREKTKKNKTMVYFCGGEVGGALDHPTKFSKNQLAHLADPSGTGPGEKRMLAALDLHGLKEFEVKGDGNCQFRSLDQTLSEVREQRT